MFFITCILKSMMVLKKALGKRIQQIRKSRKITQERLAELINIDPKNVSKIENGNSYPSAETLTAIAIALNINVYELFVFNDDISYSKMKEEIISALEDNKTILYLYRQLKNL